MENCVQVDVFKIISIIIILNYPEAATAGWKRPDGRAHTEWLSVIKKDLQRVNVTLENEERLAQNC